MADSPPVRGLLWPWRSCRALLPHMEKVMSMDMGMTAKAVGSWSMPEDEEIEDDDETDEEDE